MLIVLLNIIVLLKVTIHTCLHIRTCLVILNDFAFTRSQELSEREEILIETGTFL